MSSPGCPAYDVDGRYVVKVFAAFRQVEHLSLRNG